MMVKILNINHIGGKTGSFQTLNTLSKGMGKGYEFHNLFGYCFGNVDNSTSVYKTSNSKLYWNFRYKLAVGLNFLFEWLTPGHVDMKYLHNFKPYQEADIIHIHAVLGGFIDWKILPKISKEKKVVMTLHDDWIVSGNDKNNLFFPYKTKSQYEKRRNVFLNSNIAYVGVSNWMTNKVKNDGIAGVNKLINVYNGINTKIFNKKDKSECRKELGLPLDKKIVVGIAGAGKKSKAKGIQYNEKISREYRDRKDIVFVSLGSNEYKKISDNLIETGFLTSENMSKYFSAADLFVYPTLIDSFGLVVAESIACGCPIVTFDTGGVPEIVHHKKNGYVAKYKDYEDLKKGFEWAFDNLNKLDVELDRCFYVESMIEGYKELYNKLLKK